MDHVDTWAMWSTWSMWSTWTMWTMWTTWSMWSMWIYTVMARMDASPSFFTFLHNFLCLCCYALEIFNFLAITLHHTWYLRNSYSSFVFFVVYSEFLQKIINFVDS